jgi:hypothetical protein
MGVAMKGVLNAFGDGGFIKGTCRILSFNGLVLIATVSFLFLSSQDSLPQQRNNPRQLIINQANGQYLSQLSHDLSLSYQENRARALGMARSKGWVVRKELTDDTVIELQGLDERGMPVYYKTCNIDAADTVSTDEVWPGGSAGLDLTGSGMTIGEWDGGAVRSTHQEFNGRVTLVDSLASLSDHATHVAGTLIAAGIDPAAIGMAHQAELDSYDWNNDKSETANAASDGLMLSNHSYTSICGWQWLGQDCVGTGLDMVWR